MESNRGDSASEKLEKVENFLDRGISRMPMSSVNADALTEGVIPRLKNH